jgi:hypothetical protein
VTGFASLMYRPDNLLPRRPLMNTVSTAAAPVVDDGRAVGSAQPRGDLVERDQHQIRPLADLDRSDLVLAASQSGAIWLYYETT